MDGYSMTQNEIIRLVMQEADALGVNYLIGSSPGLKAKK